MLLHFHLVYLNECNLFLMIWHDASLLVQLPWQCVDVCHGGISCVLAMWTRCPLSHSKSVNVSSVAALRWSLFQKMEYGPVIFFYFMAKQKKMHATCYSQCKIFKITWSFCFLWDVGCYRLTFASEVMILNVRNMYNIAFIIQLLVNLQDTWKGLT